ncbi:eCIS core domain-containing protein [Microvirga massiliensis]|uniref:eCIS core domain-containing protein n=1 Tax=Microvirga massiliensis TaxID=1033741 RepID=UPI0006999537|nr:DUF4157 domain-containing protein [Microvirga massiliensis]
MQALQQTSGNAAVSRILSGGRPLEPDVRADMEQRFRENFSAVRVHTGPAAGRAADALDAEAFTHGRNVAFGPQRYAPRTRTGRELLAHELAHVIQQSRGGTRQAESSLLETGADRAATAVAAFGTAPVAVAGASAVGIARKSKTVPKKPEVGTVAEANKMWGDLGKEMKSVNPAKAPQRRNAPKASRIGRGGNSANPLAMPKEGVDMPWVGELRSVPQKPGGKARSKSSELGYRRDHKAFWREYAKKWGGHLSKANQALIAKGKAPKVDAHWIKSHPGHSRYRNQILIHHHVGQGSRAVALPVTVHRIHTLLHGKSAEIKPGEKIPPHSPADLRRTSEARRQKAVREKAIPKGTRRPAGDPASQLAAVPREQRKPVSGKESADVAAEAKRIRQRDRKARARTTKAVASKTPTATGPLSATMKASSKKSQLGGMKDAATKMPETPAATATPPNAAPTPARAKRKRPAGARRKPSKKASTKARNPKARGKPSLKAKGKIRAKIKSKVPRMKMRGRGGKYVGAAVAVLGLLTTAGSAYASTKPSETTAGGAPPTSATGPGSAATAPAGPGSAPDPAALADVAEALDAESGADAADVGTDDVAPDDAAADAADTEGGEPGDVDEAPAAADAEAPPSKLSIAGDLMSATGALTTSLPLKGKAAKVGGGVGAALQVAGLAAKLKDMHAKGASKTEMAEAAWGAAAQGAAAHVIPTGPVGMAVNIANAGAQALGAPQGAQDSLAIASDLVPSNMAAQSIGATGPMLAHAATGNWKDFDRGADNILAGQAGPALQGYFGVVTLGVDALSGKDMWRSLNQVTAKGKGSVADRVGSYLGDETYKFINRDLPEAAEFASKDIARVKKRMSDAKSAVTQRAGAMVDAAKGAAEGTIAPVKEKTTAIVNSVKRGVEQKVDAVAQSVAQKAQSAEKKIDEVKKAASERIDDVKATVTDTIDAAAAKASNVKEGVQEGIAEARNAVTEKAAPIRNKINALLDKPWF